MLYVDFDWLFIHRPVIDSINLTIIGLPNSLFSIYSGEPKIYVSRPLFLGI